MSQPSDTSTSLNAFNIAAFNALVNKANDTANCPPGSACDNSAKLAQLKRAYMEAKANLAGAPYEYEEARKNYLVFTEGESTYSRTLRQDLLKKGEQLAAQMQAKFDVRATNVRDRLAVYRTLADTHDDMVDLTDKYRQENRHLATQVRSDRVDAITNDRRAYFETKDIERLQGIYNWLWVAYFIALIVFSVITLQSIRNGRTRWPWLLLMFGLFMLLPVVLPANAEIAWKQIKWVKSLAG